MNGWRLQELLEHSHLQLSLVQFVAHIINLSLQLFPLSFSSQAVLPLISWGVYKKFVSFALRYGTPNSTMEHLNQPQYSLIEISHCECTDWDDICTLYTQDKKMHRHISEYFRRFAPFWLIEFCNRSKCSSFFVAPSHPWRWSLRSHWLCTLWAKHWKNDILSCSLTYAQ